jgi:hypothetical protein
MEHTITIWLVVVLAPLVWVASTMKKSKQSPPVEEDLNGLILKLQQHFQTGTKIANDNTLKPKPNPKSRKKDKGKKGKGKPVVVLEALPQTQNSCSPWSENSVVPSFDALFQNLYTEQAADNALPNHPLVDVAGYGELKGGYNGVCARLRKHCQSLPGSYSYVVGEQGDPVNRIGAIYSKDRFTLLNSFQHIPPYFTGKIIGEKGEDENGLPQFEVDHDDKLAEQRLGRIRPFLVLILQDKTTGRVVMVAIGHPNRRRGNLRKLGYQSLLELYRNRSSVVLAKTGLWVEDPSFLIMMDSNGDWKLGSNVQTGGNPEWNWFYTRAIKLGLKLVSFAQERETFLGEASIQKHGLSVLDVFLGAGLEGCVAIDGTVGQDKRGLPDHACLSSAIRFVGDAGVIETTQRKAA